MTPHAEPSQEALESIRNQGGIVGYQPYPKNASQEIEPDERTGKVTSVSRALNFRERMDLARAEKLARGDLPEDDDSEGAEPGPGKSIRAFCLQCVGNHNEVKVCCAYTCPLWMHRFGVRPSVQRGRNADLLNPDHIRELNAKRVTK